MTVPIQTSFLGLNKLIARMEEVLLDAYRENPNISDNPREAMLVVWESEGLSEILGDKYELFRDFFLKCTTPETISRACRKLKAEGRISETKDKFEERRQQQDIWRKYMGNGW